MRATILQHSSSPVTFLHPLDPTPDRQEQWRRCQSIDRLDYLCGEYGLATVRGWIEQPAMSPRHDDAHVVKDLVAEYGSEKVGCWLSYFAYREGNIPERPAHRCLADGAALIHGFCVRCGRDNR